MAMHPPVYGVKFYFVITCCATHAIGNLGDLRFPERLTGSVLKKRSLRTRISGNFTVLGLKLFAGLIFGWY